MRLPVNTLDIPLNISRDKIMKTQGYLQVFIHLVLIKTFLERCKEEGQLPCKALRFTQDTSAY